MWPAENTLGESVDLAAYVPLCASYPGARLLGGPLLAVLASAGRWADDAPIPAGDGHLEVRHHTQRGEDEADNC